MLCSMYICYAVCIHVTGQNKKGIVHFCVILTFRLDRQTTVSVSVPSAVGGTRYGPA